MTAHELMIKTNHYLIKGGSLTNSQKENIVRQLLVARSDVRAKKSFYKSMNYQNNTDKNGNIVGTYPAFYIPPYNDNKKLQTVIPMSPKTHILASNAYELDIIRILHLFAPEHPDVKDMVEKTFKRLENSCPGGDCCQGECFHSSLPVLRFFIIAKPNDTAWIKRLMIKINKHIEDKQKCNGGSVGYYWLFLSELPLEIAEPELLKYKDDMVARLNKSAIMNNEKDKVNNPVLFCVIRNCLSRLPEYEYIKDRQPYVSDKDGRLYFDIKPLDSAVGE